MDQTKEGTLKWMDLSWMSIGDVPENREHQQDSTAKKEYLKAVAKRPKNISGLSHFWTL